MDADREKQGALVRALLGRLMAWQPGEDLGPCRRFAGDVLGPEALLGLSDDPVAARRELLAAVEDYLEGEPRATGF